MADYGLHPNPPYKTVSKTLRILSMFNGGITTLRIRFCFSIILLFAFLAPLRAEELNKDILFDGSGFDAFVGEWKVEDPDNELRDSIWSIKEGVLHGEGGVYGWLRSKKKYGDFLLHAEYKLLAENSNTGISIRCDPYTPYGRMNPSRSGYEVQLVHGDENLHEHGPFSLYRYVAPQKYSPNPIGEWHTVETRCEGPVIRVMHNGDLVLDFDQSNHPILKALPLSGFVGLQTHGGGPIEFRNVWVEPLSKELPPSPVDPFQGLFINFNELHRFPGSWKFKSDPNREGLTGNWEEPELDDSGWEKIELGESAEGPAWFRTEFDLGPFPSKADVFLYFAYSKTKTRVFLNGRELGVHDPARDGADQRFGFRADRYLEEGTNTLAIFVEEGVGERASLGEAILLIEKDP